MLLMRRNEDNNPCDSLCFLPHLFELSVVDEERTGVVERYSLIWVYRFCLYYSIDDEEICIYFCKDNKETEERKGMICT